MEVNGLNIKEELSMSKDFRNDVLGLARYKGESFQSIVQRALSIYKFLRQNEKEGGILLIGKGTKRQQINVP